MKTLLALGLIVGASFGGMAQLPAPLTGAMRSVSGQFTVVDLRGTGPAGWLDAQPGPELLELSPPFLVVSCERVKQALYDELRLAREWRGPIRVALRPWTPGAVASIQVEKFGSTWLYQLDLPERLDRRQFARSLVQVLLLELANRTATERSAEIPLWLSEGLTQRLLASREVELILPPPRLELGGLKLGPTVLQKRDPDPLEQIRRQLRQRAALSLAELSWPEPENFSAADAEFFQGCAQLFVSELLQLKSGPERLRGFLATLPQFYNWHLAFWRAYDPQFPNQLALEKWWALQTAHFAGRDHRQLWTPAESAQQLETLLQTTVTVRTTPEELPVRTQVGLATVITEWDAVRQLATVQTKIRDLELARLRVAPEFLVWVADCQNVLQDYLKKRSKYPATFASGRELPPGLQSLIQETLPRLADLEVRRQNLARGAAIVPGEALPEFTPVQ